MDENYLPALVQAALELLPAEPSDLSAILRSDEQRRALLSRSARSDSTELTGWLCEEIEFSRVEHWYKRIEAAHNDLLVRTVLITDDGYPRQLAACWDSPPMLYVRGHLSSAQTVAIVGSRDAADQTLTSAHGLASSLAADGYSIVSGFAAGIDTAAHLGALDAGGHTVAVMGTGIRRVFPEQNIDLLARVVGQGAVVSQFAPDAPRTSTTFLRRNCVIAGYADVNVVMAGEGRSGSRHQAEQAIRYGRPVLLWEPVLGTQAWALALVECGLAAFFRSPEEVEECLVAVR